MGDPALPPALSAAEARPARARGFQADPFVFGVSAAVCAGTLAFALGWTERARALFMGAQDVVATYFGWFFILSVTFFLGFSIWIACSRFGTVKLGRDDEPPQFGTLTWFSMLFSAGMGIGMLFYGVAEPVMHYVHPPVAEPLTADAARAAMRISFFHWGLHAWAIYVAMGLALAYVHHRRGRPLAVRYALEPLLGRWTDRWPGRLVDVTAVFGTLFGLATSLGLGAMQINAGLGYLLGVAQSTSTQVSLIAGITLCATASVVTGLERGIRRLSEVNVALGALLLLFVFVTGPTVFLLDTLPDQLGRYLQQLVASSLWTDAWRDQSWQKSWTLFYWAWWIAWAPFVGTFVARISRGRTIRQFVAGVLLVPSLVTFVWFTVFGGTALYAELFGGGGIAAAVESDVATAIYALLGRLPLGAITSALAMVVVASFFVTSSDSGSFVVDMLTSGGHPDPPVWQRIFWATLEGAVAAVLLVTGGLRALQSAAINTGLPFCVVLLLICVSLVRALRQEREATGAATEAATARIRPGPAGR